MLSTDREEFEKLMKTLCAAFNTPPTPVRIDSYWRAFHKRTLAEFAHLVDNALDEDSEVADMPTVPHLRALRHVKRRTFVQPQRPADDRDTLLFFANRLILKLMLACGGMGGGLGSTGRFVMGEGIKDSVASPLLLQVRQAVLTLVDWFSPGVQEGDENATAALFIEMLERAIGGLMVIPPVALKAWHGIAESDDGKVPFPPYMARGYKPLPQLELVP